MERFLQNLLIASLHGSVVILAVILLRFLLWKTPKKFICLLWLLAGIRLLLPIEIRSDLSLQPRLDTVPPGSQVSILTPSPSPALPAPSAPTSPATIPMTEAAAPVAAGHINWISVLFWVWLGVACLFLVYTFYAYLRLRHQVREAVKVRGGWECDRIETAFILGFIRPQIYIPMGLPPEVRRHILLHERTHLEKGDHWFKMIGFLALALHWFNPLVWIAYILLCKDIEMACDERVVQFMELSERKAYSAALLRCSAKHSYLAACPVAFGEVSVKQRIQSVLRYQRPGFWISLAGVIAILFVAVCLITSPAKEPEQAPAVPETTRQTEITEPLSTFAVTLSEEQVLDAVTAGIEALCTRESCRATAQYTTVYPDQESFSYTSEIYRYGQDTLIWNQDYDGTQTLGHMNSEVFYGDLYGTHYGDYWVRQGSRSADTDINSWANCYRPEGKQVSAFRVENENTVSYDARWTVSWPYDRDYTGTFWFTFRDDGTISSMRRKFAEVPAAGEKQDSYTQASVTILDDPNPQETYKRIADQAVQCLTEEELASVRKNQNTMSEIPSNKTDYDQDVATGLVSRQWVFLDDGWHVRIGSEDVTSTGLRQTFGESGEGHASFVAEEGFWLEAFDGGKWHLLKEPLTLSSAERRSISVSWEGQDSFPIDWSDSYGQLLEGSYRLGRYYTVTMEDGRTETQPCYCKFLIRNQEADTLLKKCENGVSQLVDSTDYYIKVWDYLRNDEFQGRVNADSHDMVQEIWRSGDDFYREITYRYKSTGATKSVCGTLLRGGKGYTIDNGTVTQVDWATSDTFTLWSSFAVLFSPTNIESVYQDQVGTVHVRESTTFYDGIPFVEQQYSFTEDGLLVGYRKLYYNEAGEEILDEEMERYRTAPDETRQKIDSITVN